MSKDMFGKCTDCTHRRGIICTLRTACILNNGFEAKEPKMSFEEFIASKLKEDKQKHVSFDTFLDKLIENMEKFQAEKDVLKSYDKVTEICKELAQESDKTISVKDNINPAHYKKGKIETIEHIKDIIGDKHMTSYCIGNVIKYVSRYENKNGVEDLKKARWYLDRAIKEMEVK